MGRFMMLMLGMIIVNEGDNEKVILVTINAQNIGTLFDISSTPLSDVIGLGDNFKTKIYLLPVGEDGIDVTIRYLIRDYSGRVYYEESSTFYVDDEMSFVKEFEIDDLVEGNYVLVVDMIYADEFVSASSQFKVERKVDSWNGVYFIALVFVVVFALVIVIIKLVRKRKWKKRKKRKGKR